MNSSNGHLNLAKIVSDLANERTILAYIRTTLALLATGVAFQELFHKPMVLIIGKLLIGLSLLVFIIGIISFVKIRNSIKKQKESVSAHFLD